MKSYKIHDYDQGTRYSFLAPDSCAEEEEEAKEEGEGSDQKNKLVLVIIATVLMMVDY